MQYRIINPKDLQIQLLPNDINNSNFAFCNQKTLSKLDITVYAYRLIYNPLIKNKQHIVFIMLSQKLQDNLIGISTSVADTLCLNANQKIQFERIPLQIIREGKLIGMPKFQVAQKIEILLIQNQAQSLFDSSLLAKIQFDPFYFGLGQQFRIKLHQLSIDTFRKQSESIRRRFLRLRAKYQKKKMESHLILRFVTNGVHLKKDNLSIYYLHKQGEPKYFIYQPKKTQLVLQSIRTMRKPNTIYTQLPKSHLKIFNNQCYLNVFKSLQRVLIQQNYEIKKFAFLKTLQNYGFTQFLRFFAEQHKLNFVKYDCSKQPNLNNIKQYFNQIYTRAPYVYYIKNIDWIYELASANLDPKKTTLKFIQSLMADLEYNLSKKLDDHKIFVIFGYESDNFGINQIQGPHLNFEMSPQSHKQIIQFLVEQYSFNKVQNQQIINISSNLGWRQIQKIITKTINFPDIKKKLQKLSQRQKVAKIPNVNWDDIGGLELAKEQIIQTILLPRNFPEIFDEFIKPRTGLLFYGPPGTGKTLLAKCIANQCKMNFISVKGPQMLNMYIGQSQKNVRQTFERALNNKPCIIFFDQLDAIIPKRGQSSDSSQVMDRIVAELLTQMDIIARQGNVFVIGATNRPDLLDPSIMRPGRFDKQIYLGISSSREDRINILKAQTKKLKISQDVNFGQVVDLLPPNFTGADFYGLTSKAVMLALKQKIKSIEYNFDQNKISWQQHIAKQNPQVIIFQNHLIAALDDIKPSVTLDQLKKFEQLKQKYS